MKLKFCTVLFVFLLITYSAMWASEDGVAKSPVSNATELFLPFDNPNNGNKPPSYAARSREVKVDIGALIDGLNAGGFQTLGLNFFKDARFIIKRNKQITNVESGSVTWLGTMPSETNSLAILVISPNGIEGSLNVPSVGFFTVRKAQNGNHVVEEIKRSAIP